MSESRKKKASRNIIWGLGNKLITLVLPFASRTIILYFLGAEFLGVGTLFSSILNFLSLTEMGLGSAIVFYMYKPLAEGDTDRICALLNYYKKLYRVIGLTMLAIGTALLPAVPFLMKSGAPEGINVYILYYIYLLNSVISYFFAGYRSRLLTANQRVDVNTKIATIVNVLVQVTQIVLLILYRNFYVYACVPIAGTLCTNAAYYIITRRMYPDMNPRGSVSLETRGNIKKKISGLVGTKLNSIVVHSADTIVISTFLGLRMTAQYGNYYMIFSAVCGFIGVLFTSITAGIGNKLVTDTMEESFGLFKKLSFLNSWIVCWCSSCFLCLYEPFMELWVGELKLGFGFACLMTAYFFIYQIQKTILTFKDAAGLWHADKMRPYVSMTVNLVSNLLLVQFIGIYGIVLSTILAFAISLPWANKVLFDNLFRMNPLTNLVRFLVDFLWTLVIAAVTYLICMVFPFTVWGLLARLAVCCVVPNLLFALKSMRTEELRYWKGLATRLLIRK